MDDRLSTAARLYAALADTDAPTLYALLTDDFTGRLTAGLPHGLGREYTGADDMIRRGWGGVARHYTMRPVPEEYLATTDGRVVVLGTYRATARATGREMAAPFAHVLSFDGDSGRISGLVQVTDTAPWAAALAEQ